MEKEGPRTVSLLGWAVWLRNAGAEARSVTYGFWGAVAVSLLGRGGFAGGSAGDVKGSVLRWVVCVPCGGGGCCVSAEKRRKPEEGTTGGSHMGCMGVT